MKRFKFLFMSLVMVVCLLGSGSISSASSYSTGKAVIPMYYQDSQSACVYTISNITDAPINVIITLYKSDGTLLTDDGDISTGRISGLRVLNYNDLNTDSTVTLTLNAHASGLITLNYYPSVEQGYGVIQWTQNSNTLQGLVVNGINSLSTTNAFTRYNIPVNNGMPF